jgi:hypothetical protein
MPDNDRDSSTISNILKTNQKIWSITSFMRNLKKGCRSWLQEHRCPRKSGMFHGGWSVLFQNIGGRIFDSWTRSSRKGESRSGQCHFKCKRLYVCVYAVAALLLLRISPSDLPKFRTPMTQNPQAVLTTVSTPKPMSRCALYHSSFTVLQLIPFECLWARHTQKWHQSASAFEISILVFCMIWSPPPLKRSRH